MAKIVHSDLAPDELVHYSFGGAEFDLGGSAKKSFESDDREVISNAQAHPWLTVVVTPVKPDAPAEDLTPDVSPLAVDAGLDQNKSVTTDGVAETIAADDDHEPAKRRSTPRKDKD
jgi:hypothetical protein